MVDENARQLEPRARTGIYVGHSVRSNCPLVFFNDTQTIVSSMHVRIDDLRPMQVHQIDGDDEGDVVSAPQDNGLTYADDPADGHVPAPVDMPFPAPTQLQTAMTRPATSNTFDVRVEGGKTILSGFHPPEPATRQATSTATVATSATSSASADTTATTITNTTATTATPQAVKATTATSQSVTSPQGAAIAASNPTTTRSGRVVKKPKTLCLAVPASTLEPRNFAEADRSAEREEWMASIDVETSGLKSADTYDEMLLRDVPQGAKILPSSFKFKKKMNEDGGVEKFKARLCVGGHLQRPGIDYEDVYAPVMTSSSFRTLLAIASSKKMEVHQMDAVTAFLNGKLTKPIYMHPPQGCANTDADGNGIVYRLKKTLYGLHESPRAWNDVISESMAELGLTRSLVDPGLYAYKDSQGELQLLVGLWVDDLVIAGYSSGKFSVSAFKKRISQRYKMLDKGEIKWCLGMSVAKTESGYAMDQSTYLTQVLERFNMQDSHPTATPLNCGTALSAEQSPTCDEERQRMADVPYAAAVGCLIHLATWTRPDIAYAVGQLSRFMANPGHAHWKALQHVLRYLKGTRALGLKFTRSGTDHESQTADMTLSGYVDASWANDVDERRSTSGYIMQLCNGPIAWSSKRQTITAASTAEAEYIAASLAVREVVYLRQLLSELGFPQTSATTLHEDNQPCIHLANNNATSNRTKHIDIRYHIVRERVSSGEVALQYVPTYHQLADMLTKSVPGPQVMRQRSLMMGRTD